MRLITHADVHHSTRMRKYGVQQMINTATAEQMTALHHKLTMTNNKMHAILIMVFKIYTPIMMVILRVCILALFNLSAECP